VDLAVDDHRVDDVAAVVDRDEATDVDLARALVDVDHADVAAERERQVRRVVVVDRLEARLHPGRMVRVGRERDLLDRLEAIGRALDAELAGLPFEVVLGGLEQVGGDLLRLLPDLPRGDGRGGAGDRRGARRVRPEPYGRGVGVAVLDLDVATGKPSSSAMIWAKVVSWPWPWRLDAEPGETLPVGWTRISHESNILMPRMSKSWDGPRRRSR
jgi:hypothetical protein